MAQALLQAAPAALDRGDGLTEAVAQAEIDLLARRVGRVLQDRSPAAVARGFAQVLFQELGFRREIEATDPRYHLLPSVLTHRRGSCVGLVSVYLVVAERLGIPMAAELVPGHLHLRLAGSPPLLIETLRRGEVVDQRFYQEKYIGSRRLGPAYRRPLTAQELVAVIRFNLGNHHRDRGQAARAEADYLAAAEAFPAFAEARASLGLVQHARGDVDAARRAYQAAARVDAWLPGLAENLAALDAAE